MNPQGPRQRPKIDVLMRDIVPAPREGVEELAIPAPACDLPGMRLLSFLPALAGPILLAGCAAGPAELSFEDRAYRQVTGAALRRAVIGHGLIYLPTEGVLLMRGQCDLFQADGVQKQCADRSPFIEGSYAIRNDRVCMAPGYAPGRRRCFELYRGRDPVVLVRWVEPEPVLLQRACLSRLDALDGRSCEQR
jgi:hypothetical protein